MNKFFCVHGHFYQPPRENPWTNKIEDQPTAAPYRNWNERITEECYAANIKSPVLDQHGQIREVVNNYSKMSFNFGPTLLSWLEEYCPQVYQSILLADQESLKYFDGHGSALAQVYNHIIMPLANYRDKRLQVLWGIRDFEYRFKRKPEGMWLAETAVDQQTLDVLAEFGIKFTILAPHQVMKVRKKGEMVWQNVQVGGIDTQIPYECRLASGRTINVFFYNGTIAHGVAFGELIKNGEIFAKRIAHEFPMFSKQNHLVHIATDGETYGHHHKFGNMALAYMFRYIEEHHSAKVTVYGEFLAKNRTQYEAMIKENTSWSCVHGVERWRGDCGCRMDPRPGWNQKWRKPLREALDWLRDSLAPIYEKAMLEYCDDPWGVREEYIQIVLDSSTDNWQRFVAAYLKKKNDLSDEDQKIVKALFEMQHNALLMYTSCGWFFDDIDGLEARQVLQYAARAINVTSRILNKDLEANFLNLLKDAKSNLPGEKNGADVYKEVLIGESA